MPPSRSVQCVDLARRGSSDETEGTSNAPGHDQPINPEEVVRDLPYSSGDRIAYCVDGPESTVYGYATEAIVTELPPFRSSTKN